jgi:hypothetical protein
MRALTLAVAVLSGVVVCAAPADASCKRFGFTVNDYGKDGPTKDAKELLDKHIAEWAAQNKIKDYKTGSKTVNCELFLNFVVFDEHTCTASANVCWNDGKGGSVPETAAATPEDGEAGVPPTPIRKAAAQGHDKKTAKADAKTATPPAAVDAAPPSDTAAVIPPAETPAATEPTPPPAVEPPKAAEMAPAPPAPPAITETGTLPKDPLSALKQHAAATPDAVPAPVKSVDAVPEAPAAPNAPAKPANKRDPAAASAAATAAAAAAERAAVAAETAAAAAKEAAAAAVAASAATHGGVVPPIDAGP